MSTLQASNLKNASSASTNITLDTSGNATVAGTMAMGSSFLRNRIINGDMRTDQRNAGAAVTAANAYTLDRWYAFSSAASKYTVQRGTTNLPAGFSNALNTISSGAYSVTSSDYFMLNQRIEGYNVSDLAWGTASAKTVTLSFWVYSSLTGTFGGSLMNSAQNRSYPFTYSIPSANTNTFITITIPGDTSGTWLADNGVGIGVNFSLGMGSTYAGTAGSWAGATYYGATGCVSVVGTSAAVFNITGVQLEAGTVATPFERRLYGQELALCQRYYYRAQPGNNAVFGAGQVISGTVGLVLTPFPVTLRAAPTALEQSGTAANYLLIKADGSTVACSSVPAFIAAGTISATSLFTASTLGGTAGQATGGVANASGYLGWSAEL